MLSINIPVYNIEVSSLVLQLLDQAKKLDILFEIRVYDDGSNKTIKAKNCKISEYLHVEYIELEKNLGRAAIRNKMGFESKFDYLLFIDADSKVVEKDYLNAFIKNIQPRRVLCGGTAYQDEKPLKHEELLRWFYGKNRESISADSRNNSKGFIITSNNFLVEKEIFKQIHFREHLKKYGHEDTLFGYDLYKKGIQIFHINNPVEHTGLENSNVFIEKTKVALESLFFIQNELLVSETEFSRQVRFLKGYLKINKIIPRYFLQLFYGLFARLIEKNLTGKHPRIILFDIYKLGFYSTLK